MQALVCQSEDPRTRANGPATPDLQNDFGLEVTISGALGLRVDVATARARGLPIRGPCSFWLESVDYLARQHYPMAVTQDPVTTARFLFADEQDFLTPVGVAINADFLADEERVVRQLADIARFDPPVHDAVQGTARDLVAAVRKAPASKTGLDAFLRQYDLSSQEGVILMCLAEALLRIPDDDTADRLIADKLRAGDWASHLGDSQSLFVNASTWGLLLTGRIVRLDPNDIAAPGSAMSRVASRLGEPIVRTAMRQAMRIMGHQFVMGRTIDEALDNSLTGANKRYRYTFDMLGEAALTTEDADRYFESYRSAIESLAARVSEYADEEARPSISVKLSALHPRFERVHRQRVLRELAPRLIELCVLARDAGIALTLDTEESERLEITVELLEAVCRDSRLAGWSGFGMAVQGYQKRAPALLRYLIKLARGTKRTLHVRLVKGAYWDSEIKRAQERGLPGYPVYTRKTNTDVAYLACARILLEHGREIYPQFASHNAHTVAAVWHMARKYARQFEFQRLHGMGEELYSHVTDPAGLNSPCRVYAPVGNHEDLLPYLVRRLLENGSNTSFVNRIVNENEPIDAIVADPVRMVDSYAQAAHPRIPAPRDIYMPERRNSLGVHLADGSVLRGMADRMERVSRRAWVATPLVGGKAHSRAGRLDPQSGGSRRHRRLGHPGERRARASCARSRAAGTAGLGCDRTGGPGCSAGKDRGPVRGVDARTGRDVCARGWQDRPGQRLRGARGGGFPAVLRGPRPAGLCGADTLARAHGRKQRTEPARSWDLHVHQPLEFSAGHIHGPGCGGTGGRERSAGETGRADTAGRSPGYPPHVAGRCAGRCAAFPAGRRCGCRCGCRRRSSSRRRGVHGVDRYGAHHQSRARGP